MNYRPSDIKSPRSFPRDVLTSPYQLYVGTLGSAEYEKAAQRIVTSSQRAGRWVLVPIRNFVPPFQNRPRARNVLEAMIEKGLAVKQKEGYSLTNVAIEAIAKAYPAR